MASTRLTGTVLRWVQAFGPQLAAEARKHRPPLGCHWYTDEMFFFRGKDKWMAEADDLCPSTLEIGSGCAAHTSEGTSRRR